MIDGWRRPRRIKLWSINCLMERGIILLFPAFQADAVAMLLARLFQWPTQCSKVLDPSPTIHEEAKDVERSLIEKYVGDDLLVKDAIPPTLKLVREELAGKDPSPLERLLVEWLVARLRIEATPS